MSTVGVKQARRRSPFQYMNTSSVLLADALRLHAPVGIQRSWVLRDKEPCLVRECPVRTKDHMCRACVTTSDYVTSWAFSAPRQGGKVPVQVPGGLSSIPMAYCRRGEKSCPRACPSRRHRNVPNRSNRNNTVLPDVCAVFPGGHPQ